MDKTLYLRVQSFINSTENAFYDITYSCFLYNYHLVWSGLEQDDLRTLYRYLTTGFNEGSTDPYFADEVLFLRNCTNNNKKLTLPLSRLNQRSWLTVVLGGISLFSSYEIVMNSSESFFLSFFLLLEPHGLAS